MSDKMKDKMKEWLIGGALLAVSLYLLLVYARGQLGYTIRFVREWLE